MPGSNDNRTRVFADVVTIDAWHDAFADGRQRADLHADVVFATARVGGEDESPVRFRLSMKHAEIVVIVPDTEPVKVDPKSVSRDTPDFQGELKHRSEKTGKVRSKAYAAVELDSMSLKGNIGGEAEAEAQIASTRTLEVSQTVRLMLVTQSKTADGYYRWHVEPQIKAFLEGRPWDGVAQPRLTLVDQRKDRSAGIPPTVRVEVHCRREDLLIEDLEIKNETRWQELKSRAGFHNRMAAAESYIRDKLSEEGLEVQGIRDKFGKVTLASVTAESSGA